MWVDVGGCVRICVVMCGCGWIGVNQFGMRLEECGWGSGWRGRRGEVGIRMRVGSGWTGWE